MKESRSSDRLFSSGVGSGLRRQACSNVLAERVVVAVVVMSAGQRNIADVRFACQGGAEAVGTFIGAMDADHWHLRACDLRRDGNGAFVMGRAEPIADMNLEHGFLVG